MKPIPNPEYYKATHAMINGLIVSIWRYNEFAKATNRIGFPTSIEEDQYQQLMGISPYDTDNFCHFELLNFDHSKQVK